jgi:hypothetical protein
VSEITISVIVFVCLFCGALAGLFLNGVLPPHHIKDDSKDIVKLMVGLLATMSALVLGLLISSAKSSFDQASNELVHSAANIVALDRVLAHYGPEASEARALLKQTYTRAHQMLFSEDASQQAKLDTPEALTRSEGIQAKVNQLSPTTDAQRRMQVRALAILGELQVNRWLMVMQKEGSRLLPVVIALVCWLTLIFTAFGLFAPRNLTVIFALLVSSLSVAGAIFLILEMDRPFDGVVRISGAPLESALSHLGE